MQLSKVIKYNTFNSKNHYFPLFVLCFSIDQIISVTKHCESYGIVGVSMHLSDLAEDLIYFFNRYPNGEQINAFLCDKSGSTIWHSTFPRNHNSINHETHNTIDIKYFEKFSDDMEKKILSEKEGTKRVSNWSTGNQKQVVIHNLFRI